jgi:hypothetical protein
MKKKIEEAAVHLLGKLENMSDYVSEKGCQTCSNLYPLDFRDILSYKEFKISGICQECQDEVFTEVEEDDPNKIHVKKLDPKVSAQIEKDFYVDTKEIN